MSGTPASVMLDGMESSVIDRSSPHASSAAPRQHPGHVLPMPAAVLVTLAGAFLVGMLTSFGQAGPQFVSTMSNSGGSWFVAAMLLLLIVRPRMRWALPLGVVVLELMHVGYTVASNLRGHPDFLAITNFWVIMALPAGLLAGAVVTWTLRGETRLRSLALGLAGATLVGEGGRGLLQVAETTGSAFWVTEIIVGVLVVAAAVAVGRTPVARVVGLAAGVVGAAAVLTAYSILGG
ncbi:DUF6518 family protein [Curtobacterium sp. Leaf261]|uniref:DUF6518 family protein n=1 Tax=Curtobacterium sp. Leaf261 TaxID=1736311 RepID=UPI000700ABAD|nr:DUF6518 family protein [Curtobacterium sp. Leaf261]KQO61483.1 hypothetical protein ASF23_13595 [Curtobacterium sp. Leaf261]